MKLFKILAICALSLFTSDLVGQDVIIKKDGEKLKVKIKQVSETLISYVEEGDENEILFTINRDLIREVKILTDWKDAKLEYNELYYSKNHNNILSLNFTGLGFNALILGYERAINRGTSYTINLKFIGYGLSEGDNEHINGIGIDIGHKFKFASLNKRKHYFKPRHLMYGGYFRPQIGFASGNDRFNFNSGSADFSIGHIGLQVGMQWVIQKKIAIDAFIGFSFFKDFSDGGVFNSFSDTNFGDFAGSENKAITFGLRVGYLFGRFGTEEERKEKDNKPKSL